EDGIRDFHVTGVQTCALPISASCSSVASPAAQVGTAESAGHMNTETSTRSYQSSFMLSICIWSRRAAPTKTREMKVTRTTETVIDTLRRRPDANWDRTNRSRMTAPYRAAP